MDLELREDFLYSQPPDCFILWTSSAEKAKIISLQKE